MSLRAKDGFLGVFQFFLPTTVAALLDQLSRGGEIIFGTARLSVLILVSRS
jgi:hypothetical protein